MPSVDSRGYFNLNDFGKPQQQTATKAPVKKGNGNILSRLAGGLIAAPKYFADATIINPIKETAADFTHNKVAKENAVAASNKTLGLDNGNDLGHGIKKLAGNTAGLATTVVAPEAKVGLAAKVGQGVKVGAVAGGGSAAANDQDILKGAVEGAATGGVVNGVLGKLVKPKVGATATEDAGKVVASKQANGVRSPGASAGAKMQKYGTDLLANKLNIGTKDAEKFYGPDTVHRLNANYGLTPHQAAQLHPVITGGDGVATSTMDNALEGVGKLKFSDFSDTLKKELNDPEFLAANDLSESQAKNMHALVDKYHASLNPPTDAALTKGNAAGATIDGGTNARAAMDVARKLEKSGYDNRASASEAKNATGDMQLKMADFIKSRIYNSPGGQEALDVAKHETADHLDALAHQSGNAKLSTVADAFRNAKDWQEFRNVSAPFVNAKQLVDKSNLMDFANAGGDSASRGLFNTLYSGASKIVSPGAGKAMSKAGDVLTKATESNAGKAAGDTAGGARDIMSRLTANPQADEMVNRAGTAASASAAGNPPEQQDQPNLDAESASLLGGDQTDSTDSAVEDALGFGGGSDPSADALGGGADSGEEYSKEQLIQDINNDPKHASTFISLYNTLNPKDTSSTGGKVTAQQKGLASTGLTSLQALAQEISKNPNLVTKSATPGQSLPLIGGYITNKAGVGDYEANANQVLDALARLRTGAAMSKNEERFYRNLLPKAGDSPDTIQTKLTNLQGAFSQFSE